MGAELTQGKLRTSMRACMLKPRNSQRLDSAYLRAADAVLVLGAAPIGVDADASE